MRTMDIHMFSIFSKIRSAFMANRAKPHRLNLVYLIALTLIMLAAPMAQADDTIATATVSNNQITTGEILTLKIHSNSSVDRDELNVDPLQTDFTVHGNQFSRSIRSVNGNVTISSDWTIQLSTQKTGQLQIPSFTIDGASTQAITLQVTKDPNAISQQDVNQYLEYQSHIDKSTLYTQETTTLTTQLIVKIDPRNIRSYEYFEPSVEGATLAPVGEKRQFEKVVNGNRVLVIEDKYSVSSKQTGQYEIKPARFTANLIGRNPQTGQRSYQTVDVATKPITIKVKAKPDSYNGVWLPSESVLLKQTWQDSNGGMLEPSTTHIKDKVGEPITRTLSLSVKGVPQENFPMVQVAYPDSIRVYEDKPEYSKDQNGNTVMTLKQVIIPKQAGEFSLPSVAVPWWNSKTDKAEMAQVKGSQLLVSPSDQSAVANAAQTNTTPSATTNDQPIEENKAQEEDKKAQSAAQPAITADNQQQSSNLWPYLIAFLAIVILLGFVIWRKNKSAQTANTTDDNFTSTLRTKDGIKIQAAYNQWLQQYSYTSDEDLKAEITKEMQALMASLYSAHQQDYPVDKLIALIKQAERKQKKQSPNLKDRIARL